MPRNCKKLRGGMNPRAFYDEYVRILGERGLKILSRSFEEFRMQQEETARIFNEQRERETAGLELNLPSPPLLEAYFAIMKSCIEKGIYGEQVDKTLRFDDEETGQSFSPYNRLLQTMKTIDAQRMVVKRGTRGDKAFYNLPEWKEFFSLYVAILTVIFFHGSKPTGPKPSAALAQEGEGPAPLPQPQPERELPLPPERNQIKQQMSRETFMRIPKSIVAPEPAPAPAPAPAPESYKREIEDFKNIFKQIKIGKAGFKGNTLDVIIIRPEYIGLVRKAIFEKFGQEIFEQITQISNGYKKLANLVRIIDRKTKEEELEAILKKDYPSFNFKSLPLTPQFLTTIIELYEDEFINDLTNYLSAKEGGRRGKRKCKKCGLPK